MAFRIWALSAPTLAHDIYRASFGGLFFALIASIFLLRARNAVGLIDCHLRFNLTFKLIKGCQKGSWRLIWCWKVHFNSLESPFQQYSATQGRGNKWCGGSRGSNGLPGSRMKIGTSVRLDYSDERLLILLIVLFLFNSNSKVETSRRLSHRSIKPKNVVGMADKSY